MLLSLKSDEIQKLIESYEKGILDIKKNALSMSWYMRGGVTYIDILNMSSKEREAINEIIKENLETTKNSKLPFF